MLDSKKYEIFHNQIRIIGLFFDLILFTFRPLQPHIHHDDSFPRNSRQPASSKLALQLHQLFIICLALAWKLIKRRVDVKIRKIFFLFLKPSLRILFVPLLFIKPSNPLVFQEIISSRCSLPFVSAILFKTGAKLPSHLGKKKIGFISPFFNVGFI